MQVSTSLSKLQSPKSQEEFDKMLSMPYQSLIGGLLHLANCARPDISYAVGALSRLT